MAIAEIFAHARRAPDKLAIVHNGSAWTYGDFARYIDAAREFFAPYELPAGAVALLDVWSLLDAWVFGLALRSLGLRTCAVKSAGSLAKLGLRDVGCLVSSAAEAPTATPANAAARAIRVPANLRLAAMRRPLPGEPIAVPPGGHITLTSGTTGGYKLVARDAAMETATTARHAAIIGITGDSVAYIPNFGLWTAGGYRWPLTTWSLGGAVLFHQATDWHVLLGRYPITHLFTTPQLLAELLKTPGPAIRRNDAMRLLVAGGALPRSTLEAAQRDVTRQVFAMLAATETSVIALTPLERPDDLLWHRVHPSREVAVVDAAGTVLGPGQEGQVRIRIDDGLAGYLDDEAATREFFRGGYFHSGDLGLFGPDGRLSLRGRASDVVNVLGEKFAAEPFERALEERLGLESVCILAVPNPAGDDEIHAVLQSDGPLDPALLDAATDAVLRPFKRVGVRFAAIAALPRNELGKVERLELRRLIAAGLGKRGA